MLLMALAVLLPSLYGFGTKLLEFIALFRGDVDGAFAISPVLNYLLASVGFLFCSAGPRCRECSATWNSRNMPCLKMKPDSTPTRSGRRAGTAALCR